MPKLATTEISINCCLLNITAKSLPESITVNTNAPNKIGIAIKNENLEASSRSIPNNLDIVKHNPNRLAPGITAKHCANPIKKPLLKFIAVSFNGFASANNIKNPNKILEIPITVMLSEGAPINIFTTNPTAIVGKEATTKIKAKSL